MTDAPDPSRAARPRGERGSRPAAPKNRRGSPEAVEKRRAARHFNEVLTRPSRGALRDGRTEKKRQRLLDELAAGQLRSSGRTLKPIDVLTRVEELLSLGEPLSSLRKACRPPRSLPMSDDLIASVARLHEAYAFPVEAYAFVGIDEATLRSAGVTAQGPGPARAARRAAGSRRVA